MTVLGGGSMTMKDCPKCGSKYSDMSLKFCLLDGSVLASQPEHFGSPSADTVIASPESVPTTKKLKRARRGQQNKADTSQELEVRSADIMLNKYFLPSVPQHGRNMELDYGVQFEEKPTIKIRVFDVDNREVRLREHLEEIHESNRSLRFSIKRFEGVVVKAPTPAEPGKLRDTRFAAERLHVTVAGVPSKVFSPNMTIRQETVADAEPGDELVNMYFDDAVRDLTKNRAE